MNLFKTLLITLSCSVLMAQFDELAIDMIAQRSGTDPHLLTIANRAEVTLDMLDATLTTYKVVNTVEGHTANITFDHSGTEVDKQELMNLDREEAAAVYGTLDPALYQHLQLVAGDEPISLSIFLTDDDPGFSDENKPQAGASREEVEAFMTENAQHRANYVSERTAMMVETLNGMGYDAESARYAPVVFADVPAGMVWIISNLDGIDRIYQQLFYENTMSKARQSLWADRINGKTQYGFYGTTGRNVKVAVIEAGGRVPGSHSKLGSYVVDSKNVCSEQSDHATHVMGIINGIDNTDFGIAPQSNIRIGGGCYLTKKGHRHRASSKDVISATDRAVFWGARVLNYSLGADSKGLYTDLARYFDTLSYRFVGTFVLSAGNDGHKSDHHVGSPGLAYNVITVGNYNDKRTRSRIDDVMSNDSSYRNGKTNHNDNHKPEISAPGSYIKSAYTSGMGTMSGTSMAAPMVTGTVALMQESAAWISTEPEGAKAILMATAINNIEGASARSDKDGAGGMDTEEAVKMARVHNLPYQAKSWHTTSYACWYTGHFPMNWTEDLTAGKKTRIAIAWGVLNHSGQPNMDFDLQIIRPDGTYLTGSYSWDSASEMVEFTAPVTGTYTIRINSFRCDSYQRSVRLGYAAWQSP